MDKQYATWKAIIKRYDGGDHALFNWCDEYNKFIDENVIKSVSMEIDYILKKSYEDNDAPLSLEELDLFDADATKEEILYKFDEKEKEYMAYANDPDTYNRRVKNKGDFEVFLNSLDGSEFQKFREDFDIEDIQSEVYEWWVLGDRLTYELEKQGEIFLSGFWGRRTTGQAIKLDYSVMEAYINMIKRFVKQKEAV